MNKKDKKEKEPKEIKEDSKKPKNNKDKQYYIIFTVLVLFFVIYIALVEFANQTTYASSNVIEEKTVKRVELGYDSNKLDIPNIDEIINKNNETVKKEKLEVEKIDLEYLTEYQNNPDLPQGVIQVLQNGIVGEQEIITKKIYENDKLIKEEQIGNRITKSALNKIVSVGIGPYCKPIDANVGDKLYVTSTLLPIYLSPSEKAPKVVTIYKNEELILGKKQKDWYYVAYKGYSGWTKKECLTTIVPGKVYEEEKEEPSGVSKNISKDIKLNKPSGLTLEEFKKVLSNNKQDKDHIIEKNAEYFYYAEKQYNVNGIFIASVAVHESNWGTSKIAKKKKNLFGYGAYDRSPSESAYRFTDYSQSIDLLGRVFAKYYVNAPGTNIFDNQKASGKYYNGSTLSGVNKKYASDKNWSNAVYKWMKYFYDRI